MNGRKLTILCFASLLIVSEGCGSRTQINPQNRKLLQALQTAASAKKNEWLTAVEQQIAEKRKKKELSDEEFKAIEPIVKKAKSGDWKQANKDALALCNAQRSTSKDIEMMKTRKTEKK